MANIRNFIEAQLLDPLKRYPTTIQNTLLELITEKLETLYEYTQKFPEIISPNKDRLDILQAITNQFLFTIREDSDIDEQIEILDHILHVYRKRGSIDTIENMWKYYGGTLPEDVKVIIPSYNLFRYSISTLSGTHVFQDEDENRPGVYEIKLVNNTYPIADLKDFLVKELIAAGNRVYFTNTLHMEVRSDEEDTNPYVEYTIHKGNILYLQMAALRTSIKGLSWSSSTQLDKKDDLSKWSGRLIIYLHVDITKSLGLINLHYAHPTAISVANIPSISSVLYRQAVTTKSMSILDNRVYCTPISTQYSIARYLYNSEDELIEDTTYHGYFILADTLLGEEVI